MRVLVACEESQTVCKAFRELGHEAYSCDIQDCSGGHPEWHIQQDVLPLLNPSWVHRRSDEPAALGFEFFTTDGRLHFVAGKWDMIIAHPPCTYLTNAGARWLYAGGKLNEERYQKGVEAKEFFMHFLNADCERIAIENPVPSSVYGLPPYSQIVQPYEYGHPNTKKTCFWLKGLDPLKPTDIVEPIRGRRFQQKNGNFRYSCWEMDQRGGKDRAKERSKTFPGIAKAMAEQWAGDDAKKIEIQRKIVEVLDDIFSTDIPTPTETIADYILEEIDLAEVVPGRWVEKDDAVMHCSICDRVGNPHIDNYCPRCGAKMEVWKVG